MGKKQVNLDPMMRAARYTAATHVSACCVLETLFSSAPDILIVQNENSTNIDDLLDQFSTLSPKLKLTIKKEKDRMIKFWP